jgi:hypothetical protein
MPPAAATQLLRQPEQEIRQELGLSKEQSRL